MGYIGRTPTGSILTSADIADGSISTAKLEDNAVTTAKITDNAVTAAKYVEYPAYRNLIINGDMSIAQRGTSSTGQTGAGYKTVDRFRINLDNVGTWDITQSTDVPTGQGFAKSLKLDVTTADASLAADDNFTVQHRLEGQMLQQLKKGTSNAESLTLSFWVKTNKTGTYICELDDKDNTRKISKSYTVNSASTWEKKTITFEGDTTGAFGNDNGGSLYVNFWLVAGTTFSSGTLATSWGSSASADRAVGQVNLADSTSNEWYITGVQLEVGTSASDFEFLPYDVNYRRCQRYHFRHNPTKDAHVGVLMGFANGGSDINSCTVPVPVPMRANPSLSTDPASGSIAVRYYTPQQGTGTISSYTTLASQGDCASDGSGYLALTLNGFGGNLYATAPNGIEFESTCLILDSEL
jgi:hypothetical protein